MLSFHLFRITTYFIKHQTRYPTVSRLNGACLKNKLTKMNTLKNIQTETHKELGFAKIEVAEIVSRLNVALCSYQVFYHKLQNFHWNVVGSDFFDVHDTTEAFYSTSVTHIDKVAERVRILGETPDYRMESYLTKSIVQQSTHDQSAEFMFGELVNDITKLLETFLDAHGFAAKNGDVGTVKLTQEIIENLEINHWKLSSWLNMKYVKK